MDTIKEADISYIKKLTNPPSAIKLVLEAVCVVLDVKPVKVRCNSTQHITPGTACGRPADDNIPCVLNLLSVYTGCASSSLG